MHSHWQCSYYCMLQNDVSNLLFNFSAHEVMMINILNVIFFQWGQIPPHSPQDNVGWHNREDMRGSPEQLCGGTRPDARDGQLLLGTRGCS